MEKTACVSYFFTRGTVQQALNQSKRSRTSADLNQTRVAVTWIPASGKAWGVATTSCARRLRL
jgi:hypothetical protein